MSQRQGSRRVTSFTARVGWHVDAITLMFSDGTHITYGDEGGGDPAGPWQLGSDEFLVAVEQLQPNGRYLGSCISFETSQGQFIQVKKYPRKRKDKARFEATAGHHIVGLSFTQGGLVGIDTAYNEKVPLAARAAPTGLGGQNLPISKCQLATVGSASGILDNSVEVLESFAAGEGLEMTHLEDACRIGGACIPPPAVYADGLSSPAPPLELLAHGLPSTAVVEETTSFPSEGFWSSTRVMVDTLSRDQLLQTYTTGFKLLCNGSRTGSYTSEGMSQKQPGVLAIGLEVLTGMARKKKQHESADWRRPHETEEAFDNRTHATYKRPVAFHKEGSSTIVVGHRVAKDGWDKPVMPDEALRYGALSFQQCRAWLGYHLLPEELRTLLAVLPRCRAQLAFLRHDQASGLKRPPPCKFKDHCKHPHPVSADDIYGEIQPKQLAWHFGFGRGKGFDFLPCGSLARIKVEGGPSGALKWQVNPPAKEALLKYLEKPKLTDLVKDVRLMESSTGEPTAYIELQGMRAIDELAYESSKKSFMNLCEWDAEMKIHQSGHVVGEFAYHATDPKALVPILQSRALVPGSSKPKAVFLVEDARVCYTSMYNQGMIVKCRVRGFPWSWDKYSWATDDTVPRGTYTWLRQVSAHRQIACHEKGVEVVAVMIRMKLLLPMIDNELEKLGYTAAYHNTAQELLNRALNRVERAAAQAAKYK